MNDITNQISTEKVSLKLKIFGSDKIYNKKIINENPNLLNILVN